LEDDERAGTTPAEARHSAPVDRESSLSDPAPQAVGDSTTRASTPSPETWQSQTAIRDLEASNKRTKYLASVAEWAREDHMISVPRWTIYFQAGLLAVTATTFFLMGMMIGQNSTAPEASPTQMYDCQLTGQVLYEQEGRRLPDEGAVVIVVPTELRMMERPDPEPLQPDQFQAVENPSIAQIEALGGRVVRINRDGDFDLTLRGPREYYVLVVSRRSERTEAEKIPKADSAKIGGYFFPVENLIGNKRYQLSTEVLNRRSQNLPTIVF
jgi:hypothetical protein